MLNIPQELESIHNLIHKAYFQSNVLKTIVIENNESSPPFNDELDNLLAVLEKTVLRTRYLNEVCYIDVQPMEQTDMNFEQHWSSQTPMGKVEVDDNRWLHIQLNTLLPHCKNHSNPWLLDTLARLLHSFRQSGGRLPWFERAMLVIDEHCNLQNRQVFDQDNKGWKIIPNVLKGQVFADDDQHSLGIALVSTLDDVPACHIYVMDIADAGTYFSLYSGDFGSYFHR